MKEWQEIPQDEVMKLYSIPRQIEAVQKAVRELPLFKIKFI